MTAETLCICCIGSTNTFYVALPVIFAIVGFTTYTLTEIIISLIDKLTQYYNKRRTSLETDDI